MVEGSRVEGLSGCGRALGGVTGGFGALKGWDGRAGMGSLGENVGRGHWGLWEEWIADGGEHLRD